jgi:hypothetical protein
MQSKYDPAFTAALAQSKSKNPDEALTGHRECNRIRREVGITVYIKERRLDMREHQEYQELFLAPIG